MYVHIRILLIRLFSSILQQSCSAPVQQWGQCHRLYSLLQCHSAGVQCMYVFAWVTLDTCISPLQWQADSTVKAKYPVQWVTSVITCSLLTCSSISIGHVLVMPLLICCRISTFGGCKRLAKEGRANAFMVLYTALQVMDNGYIFICLHSWCMHLHVCRSIIVRNKLCDGCWSMRSHTLWTL